MFSAWEFFAADIKASVMNKGISALFSIAANSFAPAVLAGLLLIALSFA